MVLSNAERVDIPDKDVFDVIKIEGVLRHIPRSRVVEMLKNDERVFVIFEGESGKEFGLLVG